jgi:hypothetical protein
MNKPFDPTEHLSDEMTREIKSSRAGRERYRMLALNAA